MRPLRQAGPVAGLLTMAALAGALVVASWLVLDAPHVSCGDRPAVPVAGFRRAAIGLHLAALVALAAVVVRMSRLQAGAGLGVRAGQGLAAAGTVTAACLVHHPLFGYVALPGLVSVVLAGPLAVLVAVLAAVWAFTRRRPLTSSQPSPGSVAAVAWVSIVLLVPGHLALVLLQTETLFCF